MGGSALYSYLNRPSVPLTVSVPDKRRSPYSFKGFSGSPAMASIFEAQRPSRPSGPSDAKLEKGDAMFYEQQSNLTVIIVRPYVDKGEGLSVTRRISNRTDFCRPEQRTCSRVKITTCLSYPASPHTRQSTMSYVRGSFNQ